MTRTLEIRFGYADSVTGDRTVVVRDPSDNVCIFPIEELWRLSQIESDGTKQRARLDGWSALARCGKDSSGDGWFPIRQIIRHRVDKKLWKVSTKRGQTEVTSDHGIMVGTDATRPEDFIAGGARFESVSGLRPTARRDDPCPGVCGLEVYLNKSGL